MNNSIEIYTLSERALTIEVGNTISEENHFKVLSLQRFIQQLNVPGFVEMVPAYCTLTVYYDPLKVLNKMPDAGHSIFERLKNYITPELKKWQPDFLSATENKIIDIPVCYETEFAPDLEEVASFHHISTQEIIQIHSAVDYRVFMMGFSPGFPYLGILPEIISTPRKNQPRIKVAEGSVGIGGNQTGIYPIETPGGWNLIGRTPFKLFDKEKENPFLLKTGDHVKFIPISKEKFFELAPP